jgi:hypothetical protein
LCRPAFLIPCPPLPPPSPALIQLHHYAWWHAVGDGITDGGLFYYPAGEAQLGVFAQVRLPTLPHEERGCRAAARWPVEQGVLAPRLRADL